MLGRWAYYGSRKRNILQQILSGEREELPEWEDDRNNEEESSGQSDNESKEGEEGENANETKSEAPKLKQVGNISLYRNNYKHVKASLKKDSYFFICSYCKNTAANCRCEDSKSPSETTQDTLPKSN